MNFLDTGNTGKQSKVLTPNIRFVLGAYRDLGIKVLAMDFSKTPTGGKPRVLVDAPASVGIVPTFNLVEVRRRVGGLSDPTQARNEKW